MFLFFICDNRYALRVMSYALCVMSKHAIFEKKNVLVVGGAGFVGSHLCDELIKTCKVICVDNFSSGNERNIDHLFAEPDFYVKNAANVNGFISDLENRRAEVDNLYSRWHELTKKQNGA